MERSFCVLIVDDNVVTRYAMRRVVERHGYRVVEAGTGGEGLALVRPHAVDIMLLDVNLPDMSGFDVVRTLRADASTAMLPVIHVSAASIATGDLITGLDAGADAYLIHPVDPDVLLATIRTLLRVRDTQVELQASEARFREMFSSVAAPIAVIDAKLELLESNPAFLRFLGPQTDGVSFHDCFDHGQDAALRALRIALSCGQRWEGHLRLRVLDNIRETHWVVAPYRQPEIGIAFVEDVTQLRERERFQSESLQTARTMLALQIAAKEKTEAQLLQSQKMDGLGKLTGGIAHDFNNLLTSIITGSEMLGERLQGYEVVGATRLLDIVIGSAQRAAALTHRLLAFARQQPLVSRPTDVNECIQTLEDLLRRTLGEQVEIALDLCHTPAVASIDPNQLENAILNLAINARDAFAGHGRIAIRTAISAMHADEVLADGDYVSITVSDNGKGIEPHLLEKVFEPFFTTKPIGEGTGLGLSTIYGFARQSGGIVRIRSELGQGTDVEILLPRGSAVLMAGIEKSSTPPLGRGEKILLVEDMPSVRLLVADVLTTAGYRCEAVEDAHTALRILAKSTEIGLLLTDVGLPGMNGRDLADSARREHPALPILFMTGYAENMNREDFLGVGMNIVTKPFQMSKLLSAIREMLDG